VVKGTGARTPHLVEHARAIIEPSGRILVQTGISPHGQGSETTFALIVADTLGVRSSDVRVLHGDMDDLPAAPAAVANAVLDALAPWGIRQIDTPLTPEKIWRAIQGANI
jgi:CO/xanthine dehydrogenase Mo-binding subunit